LISAVFKFLLTHQYVIDMESHVEILIATRYLSCPK